MHSKISMKCSVGALAVLLVQVIGCGKVGDDVKQATANIQDGARALSKGMEAVSKVDPVALNKLLAENEDLRKQLTKVAAAVNSFQGHGVTELANRNVMIAVTKYTGSHRISAWIDSPQNWFWKDRVLSDSDVLLPFEFDGVMRDAYFERDWPSGQERWSATVKAAEKRAQHTFENFLRTSAIIPGPDYRSIDLNTRFGSPGLHTINFELTPIANDRHGRWSVRVQVILKKSDGSDEVVQEFDLDSDKFPEHPMGTALPAVQGVVSVRTN